MAFLFLIIHLTSAQTLLPLNQPVQGTLTSGSNFSYYFDVSPNFPNSLSYLTADISVTSGVAYYQIQLKFGDGSIYTETRPTATYYNSAFQLSTERLAGDISGRWYFNVYSCGTCTGTTTTANYQVTVQTHDFETERKLTLNDSGGNTGSTIGDSWAMLYFDVTEPMPAYLQVNIVRTSTTGYSQIYLGQNFIPTTSTYTYTGPNGNNFYIANTLVAAQVINVGIANIGRWFVGIIGCDDCNSGETLPYTVGKYNITVATIPMDTRYNLLAGAGKNTLGFDEWDIYYLDLPQDKQQSVVLTLQNTTATSYFKMYTRKGAFPSVNTYNTMLPSSTTYSGNITLTIVPQSSDLGGRWYIGVRFCKYCNSNNSPWLGGYIISAALSSSSLQVDKYDPENVGIWKEGVESLPMGGK